SLSSPIHKRTYISTASTQSQLTFLLRVFSPSGNLSLTVVTNGGVPFCTSPIKNSVGERRDFSLVFQNDSHDAHPASGLLYKLVGGCRNEGSSSQRTKKKFFYHREPVH